MLKNDFRGELALKLNEEQKKAAINIVKAQNKPLPYLLFGPAGSIFDFILMDYILIAFLSKVPVKQVL